MLSVMTSSAAIGRGGAIAAAAEWLGHVLLGSVGLSIAVLAIAFVGLGMLTGRIAAQRGMRVVLGCFILFGASAIATSIMGLASGSWSGAAEVVPVVQSEMSKPTFTPPPARDPYAGASVPN